MLVSFEGIDGSGKSTQARLLVERAKAEAWHPLLVREPGGTGLSERVRSLLLDRDAHILPRAELLLFSAARAQLVDEVIVPALDAGRLVVADRFYDSTTAYQGAGRNLADAGWLRDFHAFVTDAIAPARTYLVDVPLDVAAARRGGERDRMEGAGADFFARVRTAYLALADAEPDRIVVLDGTHPVEDLHAEIVRDVSTLLGASAAGTDGTSVG